MLIFVKLGNITIIRITIAALQVPIQDIMASTAVSIDRLATLWAC